MRNRGRKAKQLLVNFLERGEEASLIRPNFSIANEDIIDQNRIICKLEEEGNLGTK